MTIKKKHFILIALITCGLVLSIWAFVNYQTKRKAKEQYNNALAQRFDEIIEATFPLLENYAQAMKGRADSVENIARKSKEDTCYSYRDAIAILWERYANTEEGKKCYIIMEEYEYFQISPVIEMLVNSGEIKKNESDAIKKLTWAGVLLREPYFLEYDSIINASIKARQLISECMEVIDPYRGKEQSIHAWRNYALMNYRHNRIK